MTETVPVLEETVIGTFNEIFSCQLEFFFNKISFPDVDFRLKRSSAGIEIFQIESDFI